MTPTSAMPVSRLERITGVRWAQADASRGCNCVCTACCNCGTSPLQRRPTLADTVLADTPAVSYAGRYIRSPPGLATACSDTRPGRPAPRSGRHCPPARPQPAGAVTLLGSAVTSPLCGPAPACDIRPNKGTEFWTVSELQQLLVYLTRSSTFLCFVLHGYERWKRMKFLP